MEFKIDIREFLRQFNREYEFLYKHNDMVTGYYEALDAGDKFIKKHPDFIKEFVKYRGDCISSDREVAAFMFALEAMS